MRIPRTIIALILAGIAAIALAATPLPKEEAHVVYMPLIGKFGPDSTKQWFAGRVITFSGDSFHYKYFTDALSDDRPEVRTGLDGVVRYFPSYLELTYPNGKKAYYVVGYMNRKRVLWDWDAYWHWKQTGEIDELGILYEE